MKHIVLPNSSLLHISNEAEKHDLDIKISDVKTEMPKADFPDVRMANWDMPNIQMLDPISIYPSGQENRRRRREMKRKNKK